MQCPYCLNEHFKVLESREVQNAIRRRRECLTCNKRFTTYERIENIGLYIIKRDSTREEFNPEKIRKGVNIACQKRPITGEQVENLISEVEQQLRSSDNTEIKSRIIGEIVMKKLKKLDKVAFIRFASVYRDFADVESFIREANMLVGKKISKKH